MGSNRTFMELKLQGLPTPMPSNECSNRTFMELKYSRPKSGDMR